jgi:hypothetical protein
MVEAVGVDIGDGGLFAEALEDGEHGAAAEGPAAAGEEEGSWLCAAEALQVVARRLTGFTADPPTNMNRLAKPSIMS